MLKNIFKRTFIKYLLSYILCLILPVSIFSFLYKTIYLSAFTDQLIGRTSQSLDDAFGIIDLRMSNLRDISSQVFLSRDFSDSYLNETPGILAYYTIKETLKVFSVPNEFIFDIWVFDRNNNSFYSSRHMLSLDSFIRYGSGYFGVNDKTFDQIINSVNGEIWIPGTNYRFYNISNSLLSYISGNTYSYTHSNSILIIILRHDIFDMALRAVLPYNNSTAAVIDRDGQILYSFDPSVDSTLTELLERGELENNTTTMKVGNNYYFVKTIRSDRNQLAYVSIIPYGELTRDIQKYTITFFFILLGITLCGSFLIFLLMQYNYKPLGEIIRFSRSFNSGKFKTGTEDGLSVTDEIDMIHTALKKISEENIDLSIKNEKYLREELLFNLLKGINMNAESFMKANINISASRYMAIIFQLEGKKSIHSADFENIIRKAVLSPSVAIHILDYLEQNSFIGIVVCREETSDFSDILQTICLEIEKHNKLKIQVTCGNPVSNIKDLPRSYSEAKTVLRYQIRSETNKVIEFRNRDINAIPDYLYIQAELNTLEESVRTNNPARVAFIISELIDTIKNENTSYFYAVCLCYNIINIFLAEVHRIRNSVALDIIKKHQKLFYENFDHPVENLIAIVLSLSRETMRIFDQEQTLSHTANRSNILKFIEANYRDNSFCIQSVLDHFGISFSNLSHQFKSYTGENISSYISALRMNYAKELLSTSDFTVNEIAIKLGYFQASSFIKKFRSTEGITPGDYRKKQQAGKEE